MRRIPFTVLLCISFLCSFGQTAQIKGKVTDENNAPLSGVSVSAASGGGTQTNAAGVYEITVANKTNATLTFSSTGYTSKTVKWSGSGSLNVTLSSKVTDQEEVVVIGYATQKRKDVTGSVSSVNAKQLKDIPLSSAAEALQGRLAGVTATASEGGPGAEIVIRVRGGSSITQDNAPLYIVDGVVVEKALDVISPQDIASIDVLKDASTTAIYGARAANGVVIITTKSGRPGKTVVSYNGSVGVRKIRNTQAVLSPYDFVVWQYERSRGTAADSSNFAQTYGTTWDTLNNYKNVNAVNWQDEVFGRSANYQNHNVSVSGGDQKTTFNLSLTANKEQGIQLGSAFDRYLANIKVDHKISNRVKVGIQTRYLNQKISGAGTTNSGSRTTNRLRHSIQYRPFELNRPGFGADDFDEAYYLASSGAINPVILTQAEYRRQYSNAVYLSGYFSATFAKNFTFRTTGGFDNTQAETDLFYSKITSTARNFASLPVASIGNQDNKTFTNSNTLQYQLNNYKQHHSIGVLVGEETIDQRYTNQYVETRYYPADIDPRKALANLGLGAAPTGSSQPLPTSYISAPSRIFSLFSRVTYGYDDKYLLTLNVRSDRSSKFAYENGALVFPSGSAAWRFSQEKFLKDAKWLTDGKLRVGYGSVGNNRIGDFLYLQLYGVTGQYALNHSILPGFAPNALANPNLRWEKNTTKNLGLDLAFFKNRLNLSIDAYDNVANDLLLNVPIPPTTGYASQIQNVGSTSNKGLEFQLSGTPIQNKSFLWSSNFNISFNKNKVLSLGGVDQQTITSGWQGSDGVDDYLLAVGQPIGQMYGFVTDGYYKVSDFDYNATTQTYTLKTGIAANAVYGVPQPGMLKWKDLNGDGVITADKDRQVIGNANPKFTGGWNNQFSYKNIDASIFVNFVVGNDIYNANKLEWTDGAFPNLNMLNIMKNRFTNINGNGNVVTDPAALEALNANATIWSPVRVQRWWLHSWAVEDGSYLRLNNITLGYTLPKELLKKAGISSLRIYGTANNLYTFTNYSGYDPDVTARRSSPLTPGVDFAAYPRSTTYVMGVNVNF